jgi:hypothetical protein
MIVTGAGSLSCMRSGTGVLHAASFMMQNIVFKHAIALIYLFYTYISVLNATYNNVLATCFSCIWSSSGVVCLAKIFVLYVKVMW